MLLNYKRVDIPSQVPLEDIVEELFINTTTCFGGDDDEHDYAERLVEYLHNDLKVSSSPSSSTSISPASSSRTPKSASPTSPAAKRARRPKSVVFYDQEYVYKKPNPIEALQNRWELFVLFANKRVAASCLVHFNDMYRSCEIHEVCVGQAKKGYCKELISQVRDHIAGGLSGKVDEIRIFCHKKNTGAYKCYQNVFVKAKSFDHQDAVSWVYSVRPS